jgi:hypothetical protein
MVKASEQLHWIGSAGSTPVFSRRHFLFGALGGLGTMLLCRPAQGQTPQVTPRRSAGVCIFINLDGAPSQLDTFDPKDGPWNPRDVDLYQHAGGWILSRRYFPILSTLTGDICAIRSMASWELAHSRGQFYLQTGHTQNPAFATDTPHVGAVVAFERGGSGPLPAYLSLNGRGDEQRQGFLPGSAAPFSFYPQADGLHNLRHDFLGQQSKTLFEQNFALIEALEAPLLQQPLSNEMAVYGQVRKQARGLVYNDQVSTALKFSQADESRYGNSNLGRSLITARNLVRAKLGTAFISVTHGNWDIHAQQFNKQANQNIYRLTNELDRALGNLVMDLRESGHLSTTLIVVLGEFGRTPGPLNSRDGRDHHRSAMSALMIGGGVRGGRAIGKTDAVGQYVIETGWHKDRPIYPEDIVATIYSALGIQWTKALEGAISGRRFEYITGAAAGAFGPVEEVFA